MKIKIPGILTRQASKNSLQHALYA